MSSPKKKSKQNDDKSKDSKGINFVRGGSVCDPAHGKAAIVRGSERPAICRTTNPKSSWRSKGIDTRPRWRAAGGK